MDIISKETIKNLIMSCEGLALSIYMPTFETAREARQNPIRLKNLMEKAEDELINKGLNHDETHDFLAPLDDLINDEVFWQEQDEGLALFLDTKQLIIYRLPMRFDELMIIGESFYIIPLVPIYKGNGQYFLLALDQKEPTLFQGSKFKLARVDELDLPESLQNMLDEFYEFHSHLQFHNKTVNPNPDLAAGREGVYFGQGGDDIDENAEIRNYFHLFDEALMEYLDGEDAPLILAGLGYLHPLYQEANSYPNLVIEGITKDIDSLEAEELHTVSWQIVKGHYQHDVDKALGVYEKLKAKNDDTTEDLSKIVSAAYFQRVHSLFLAEDTHQWGRFDPEDNTVTVSKERTPQNQDLLNLAAIHTLMNGGNILVLPKEQIPGDNLASAILRF